MEDNFLVNTTSDADKFDMFSGMIFCGKAAHNNVGNFFAYLNLERRHTSPFSFYTSHKQSLLSVSFARPLYDFSKEFLPPSMPRYARMKPTSEAFPRLGVSSAWIVVGAMPAPPIRLTNNVQFRTFGHLKGPF